MKGKSGTLLITNQMHTLLDSLEADMYTRPLTIFHQSTIGQHFQTYPRVYICLLEGASQGKIDYSERKRNETISGDANAAKTVLEYIEQSMETLSESSKLHIVNEYGDEQPIQMNVFPVSDGNCNMLSIMPYTILPLSNGIETVWPEFMVDAELGIAPSTLKFYKNKAMGTEKSKPYALIVILHSVLFQKLFFFPS